MKSSILFVVTALIVWSFCSYHPSEEDKIKQAKAIRISYLVEGKRKTLTIIESKLLRDVLATFAVEKIQPVKVGSPKGWEVVFVLPNGTLIETRFLRRKKLDSTSNGLIHLKSSRFYEKIQEVLTRVEGKSLETVPDDDD